MKLTAFLLFVVILSGCTSFESNENETQSVQKIKSVKSDCTGEGPVNLSSPMNFDDISMIIPMGAMVGGHVTPIDHMYFSPKIFDSPPDTYEVYADADGVITNIQHEPHFSENKYEKYRIVIMHTCDFYSIYNLLTSLSPDILEITGDIPPGENSGKHIQVKKGQILGKIGGQTLDLSVNYDKVILKGFIVPEHYAGEEWKIHTVDPFDYFVEPDKSTLLSKNLRQVEPRGGRIDYDIDGRLVGNWFVEGTGGYPQEYVPEVWRSHASFVYDPIDPSHVIVSLGDFAGEPKQFSVKGNSPDPKDVTISTGLVKYELAQSEYVHKTGENWDRMSYADDLKAVSQNHTKGVVLVKLISERKLKLESFPEKTTEEVTGFTPSAKIYER